MDFFGACGAYSKEKLTLASTKLMLKANDKCSFHRTLDDNAAVAGVVGEFEFAAPEPVLDPRFPVRDELSDERLK